MTVQLFLSAMAEKRHIPSRRECPEQAKGELLSMILDDAVARIDAVTSCPKYFGFVEPGECAPANGRKRAQQLFAGAQIRHPDIITIRRQASPTKTCGENAEAISFGDWRMHRFGFQHMRRNGDWHCVRLITVLCR